MKIYIASGVFNKVSAYTTELLIASYVDNVSFTSEWYKIPNIEDINERAKLDFKGVRACDLLLAIFPYGKSGTICEMTLAVALNKYCFYVRPEEFEDEDPLIIGLTNNVTSSRA